MPPRSYVPDTYRPDSTIADLILRQGDISAQNTANLYGGISQGLGQIGGAVAQYGQDKAAKAAETKQQMMAQQRDAQFQQLLSDPNKPPTLAQVVGIYGPDKGVALYKGVETLKAPKPDPKILVAALKAATPEMRAKGWPAIRQKAIENGAQDELLPPDVGEWTPQHQAFLEAYDDALSGKKPAEAYNLSPGEKRFGPDGKLIAENAPMAKPGGTHVVGGNLVDDAGKVLFTAPREPKEGPAGTWTEAVGADGKPVQLNTTTNQTRPYPEGVSPKANARERAVTGAEKQVLAFYNRAQQAADDIAPLEDKISKAGLIDQGILNYGGVGSNLIQSEEQQQYRQAQRAFTEARLRKESGAAISDKEYEKDSKTYFAQPGDKPELVKQKKAAREKVLDGLRYASGKAYEDYYGSPPPTAKNQGAPGASAFKVGKYSIEVE